MLLIILSTEILDDVRAAAWLEGELHPELDRHRRHEIADICEPGNVERVWRILALCEAQIRLALARILRPQTQTRKVNHLQRSTSWDFQFRYVLGNAVNGYLREKIHDYMVSAVMADRTQTIIPPAAPTWQQRRDAALQALQALAATNRLPTGPVRRPLWPL